MTMNIVLVIVMGMAMGMVMIIANNATIELRHKWFRFYR